MNSPTSVNTTHQGAAPRVILLLGIFAYSLTVLPAGCVGKGLGRAATSGDGLPHVLNLNPYYSWRFASSTNSFFRNIHGRQVVDGLPFDVNGECVLYGKSEANRNQNEGKSYPQEISGIEIGRAFAELHLIHTAWWHEFHGCPVAAIRLHYSDGETFEIQLRYCVQVLANRLPTEEREILTDPQSKLIWRGPGPWNGSFRLVKTVLQNPFPHEKVETMDVLSDGSRTSYALVAATVAGADPRRTMTAACPLNQPGRQFDGSLKLQVLDKETGEPIAGADVYPNMIVDDVGLVADPMLTSKSGEVIVKYPIARTSAVGVEVSQFGYQAQRTSWQSGNIPDVMTYRLAKNVPPAQLLSRAVHHAQTPGEDLSE